MPVRRVSFRSFLLLSQEYPLRFERHHDKYFQHHQDKYNHVVQYLLHPFNCICSSRVPLDSRSIVQILRTIDTETRRRFMQQIEKFKQLK